MNKITPITINISATLNIYQEKPFAWREIKSTTAPYLNLSNTLPNAPPIIKEIPNLEIKNDSFLNNEISIDRASELIKFKTHHYAKRQITWMNNQMISWNSINTQYSNKIIKEIIKKL